MPIRLLLIGLLRFFGLWTLVDELPVVLWRLGTAVIETRDHELYPGGLFDGSFWTDYNHDWSTVWLVVGALKVLVALAFLFATDWILRILLGDRTRCARCGFPRHSRNGVKCTECGEPAFDAAKSVSP